MTEIDTQNLISQMRAMAAAAGALQPAPQTDGFGEFSGLLKQAIEDVNTTQQSAADMATAYELGDKSIDLPDVMIAMQKARISFQAMIEVRNHLVSAYKDVLNMPV